MGWSFLIAAVFLEVLGTIAAKYANGLTNLLASLLTFLAYYLSFSSLTLALKTLDLSIAYPLWTGSAILLISLLGICLFHEAINWFKILSILMVLVGILGIAVSERVYRQVFK